MGVVSRYTTNPDREHWNTLRWVLRYLRGTSNLKLSFGSGDPFPLDYTDSDMAGDVDGRFGYLISFAREVVAWQSRLQRYVALSTTKTEFIATTETCKELLWMKGFTRKLGLTQNRYTLLCDNQRAIHLVKNSTFHSRSKHIDVRYHWIRDTLEANEISLKKVHTGDNGTDMLIKPLLKEKFEFCRHFVSIVISTCCIVTGIFSLG